MKAIKIAVKEAKKRGSKSFKEMVPEWLHDYRNVFEVKNLTNYHPEGNGITQSN